MTVSERSSAAGLAPSLAGDADMAEPYVPAVTATYVEAQQIRKPSQEPQQLEVREKAWLRSSRLCLARSWTSLSVSGIG